MGAGSSAQEADRGYPRSHRPTGHAHEAIEPRLQGRLDQVVDLHLCKLESFRTDELGRYHDTPNTGSDLIWYTGILT